MLYNMWNSNADAFLNATMTLIPAMAKNEPIKQIVDLFCYYFISLHIHQHLHLNMLLVFLQDRLEDLDFLQQNMRLYQFHHLLM